MIAAALVFTSCSSDGETTPIHRFTTPEEAIAEKMGFTGDDFAEFSAATFKNTDFLIGIQAADSRFLTGVYDNATGKKIINEEDETYPTEIQTHIGYGEYATEHLQGVFLGNVLAVGHSIIFSPTIYYQNDEGAHLSTTIYTKLARYNGNDLKVKKRIEKELNGISKWYLNSIAVLTSVYENGKQHYRADVLSEDLDSITSYPRGLEIDSIKEVPLAYDQSIIFFEGIDNHSEKYNAFDYDPEQYISRYDYSKQEYEWVSENIYERFGIRQDARVTFTLGQQSGSLWTVSLHAVDRDGTSQDIAFKLNIETGAIISMSSPV